MDYFTFLVCKNARIIKALRHSLVSTNNQIISLKVLQFKFQRTASVQKNSKANFNIIFLKTIPKQLNPIELYAMRFVEETGGSWTAEQLRAAEAEIEQQKREWEANRLAAIKKEEEDEKRIADDDDMLTFSREDAQNQVNNNKFNKRNPVNRRLLKVKQSDRHGVVRNKRVKGRLSARQPIRTGAQKTLGPRRALRNNSKPISSLAHSNSPIKKSQSAGVKRVSSMRISTRSNKQPKRTDDANISSDDETIIELNKNNINVKNHAKLLKNDNDATTEQSECSEQRHSEDFDDSECSLDVMVDSTDPQESDEDIADDEVDENNDNDNDHIAENENESTLMQSDASMMSLDETDADASKENSISTTINKNNTDKNHQIDINSPRSTRSHGRIKINLWTLDESQNLPELCAKRSYHKTTGSKNTSLISNSGCANENETCETNGSSAEDIFENDVEDIDNSAKVDNTPNTGATKQSKVIDCYPKSSNDPVNENARTRKSLPLIKSERMEKPAAAKTPIGPNDKNHISNYDLNRTPKVVLNKHDCEIQQQKARLKSKT